MKVQNLILLNRTDYLLGNVVGQISKSPGRCLSSLGQTRILLTDINKILTVQDDVTQIAEGLKPKWLTLDHYNDILEQSSCPLTY